MLNKMSLYRIKKGLVYLRYFGPKEFLVRLQERTQLQKINYEKWYQKQKRSGEELAAQKKECFACRPLISLVVPLYQAPEDYLEQMMESVFSQTYANWELCVAGEAEELLKAEKILQKNPSCAAQIRMARLERNNGIADSTNEAIQASTGEYIGFLDQDDLLTPDALYEVAKSISQNQKAGLFYSDEDKVTADLKKHFQPHMKPEFNLDLLRSNNYICHFCVIKKSLIEEVGGLQSAYNGAQDYDLILRCVEKKEAVRIPRVLYHWRMHQDSTADNPISKTYAFDAGKRAIEAHLARCQEEAEVVAEKDMGFYRVRYKRKGTPGISIIIPSKDHVGDLKRCLASIRRSSYSNYEIIIVENNSENPETFAYYEQIKAKDVRVLVWEKEFNYSAINNYAVRHAKYDYLLFLNNDVEAITPDWIEEMLANCQRKETGAVGAKLYYPNGRVQHAGIVVGIRGVAANMFSGLPGEYSGYMHKASIQQDMTAVTAACMMMRRQVFEEVGGFEEEMAVAFNDVDLCLRIRENGYLVIYDPYARLYHYESKSRGAEDNEEKIRRFQKEIDYMQDRWKDVMEKGDPMYNPNFTLKKSDYSLGNPEELLRRKRW